MSLLRFGVLAASLCSSFALAQTSEKGNVQAQPHNGAQARDGGSAAVAKVPTPDSQVCPQPRNELGFFDACRLGEPEIFDCLLKTAATTGDERAIQWAQALLWEGKLGPGYGSCSEVGGLFPRSESRLKRYIDLGVEAGSHYSILAKAAYLQDIDPATSLGLYERAAKEDDCRAQVMLAWMYQNGVGVEVNDAVAYFWARLATRRESFPKDDYRIWHDGILSGRPVPYFESRIYKIRFGRLGPDAEKKNYCRDLKGIVDLARLAKAPFAEEVHDDLLQWRPGQGSPESLARYSGQQAAGEAPQSVLADASKASSESDVTSRVRWNPVSAKFGPTGMTPKTAESMYDELSKSVYVVVAASNLAELRAGRALAQGSAVAVDFRTLITNCHIIEDRPVVRLATKTGLTPLKVIAARQSADTCVLGSEGDQFVPVPRIRRYGTLKVGEAVIAIGSPRGFTNSLTTGIVSQLRTMGQQRLVQTSAPISGGSSGGGLFDARGNLIGITTFSIRESEGLNFAIAVDEYVQ